MEEAVCIKSDAEEEYFPDCIFEDEMKSETVTYTSKYVESEEIAINDEPLETPSSVVKDQKQQHTQSKDNIRDEYYPDFDHVRFEIKTEMDELDSINTVDDIKCEEIDIKYKPVDDIRLSSTENEKTSYSTCNKTYGTLAEENVSEILRCLETPLYECSSCPYKTPWQSYLPIHMLKHADPSKTPTYECYNCQYKTRRKSCLKKHMLVHTAPSKTVMYKCKICPHKTRRKNNIQIHMLSHTDPSDVPIYECNICPYKTPRKGSLQIHMFVHENPSKKPVFECNICHHITLRKYSLQRHMVMHTNP